MGVPSKLILFLATRLIAEKRRIEKEEDTTESELLALQQQMNERISRLTRLRRQKKMVISRGHEMIRRGLKSLDELEEAERRESDAVIDVQVSGGLDVVDWNVVFGDGFLPSGDTPPVTTESL